MKLDVDTVKQLKLGYESAFDKLYIAYEKSLYFLILSIVKDCESAKDILQETFIKVFIDVKSLKKNETFNAWIMKVAKNLSLNYIKHKNRYREITEDDIFELSVSNYSNLIYYDFLHELSLIDKLIVTYHTVYEFTFQEIGIILHKSPSCVAKRYYSNINRLKNLYKANIKKKTTK